MTISLRFSFIKCSKKIFSLIKFLRVFSTPQTGFFWPINHLQLNKVFFQRAPGTESWFFSRVRSNFAFSGFNSYIGLFLVILAIFWQKCWIFALFWWKLDIDGILETTYRDRYWWYSNDIHMKIKFYVCSKNLWSSKSLIARFLGVIAR